MRGQLTKTDKALTKAKNWADRRRKEAKAQKRSASRARTRVAKLNHQLDAASAGRELAQAAVPMDAMPSGRPVTEPTTVDGVTVPNETWSVVQLRAEARVRG